MSFEKVPEGFEFVGIRRAVTGDWYITPAGRLCLWGGPSDSDSVFSILHKIEAPKQYRAFASKAEFAPHRDRWVVLKDGVNNDELSVWRIAAYDFDEVLILRGTIGNGRVKFTELFENFVFVNLDGTFDPCGVEVAS